MDDPSDDEGAARSVLAVLVEKLGARPGDSIPIRQVQAAWTGDQSSLEFDRGVKHAVMQGWVELPGINIHLTRRGQRRPGAGDVMGGRHCGPFVRLSTAAARGQQPFAARR